MKKMKKKTRLAHIPYFKGSWQYQGIPRIILGKSQDFLGYVSDI